MMEHKWSPVSIEQGNLTSLTPKRHKAGLSISPRKDKVGERIAALQQLVSPYGKTDTASVLLEAIEYIHFLHDQVKVSSAPYLHSNPTAQSQDLDSYNLKAKGLCLVPVSYMNGVGSSNGADIWAPIKTPSPKW
ncbi:putative transcription factor bHLH family [Helianthus annuus]|nr:putative transcription factor bHLH family [Helianthus annuus]